ncbi:hypothetical protein AC578_4578 [Pseudocercospora eumusae]|uniref:Uncharacterized protein n=1 Tax=Pseudocercospora eumusae TaxID=321146 RepID=A0A139H4J3_9PEZI|nr:hypothetical protein AC578_4578 [Pseudocercospora eumusae]
MNKQANPSYPTSKQRLQIRFPELADKTGFGGIIAAIQYQLLTTPTATWHVSYTGVASAQVWRSTTRLYGGVGVGVGDVVEQGGVSPTPRNTQCKSAGDRALCASYLVTTSFSSTTCSTFSNPYSSCAYASWPAGSDLKKTSRPSAYVSDEDLFGDDDEAYLSEPPPPPRSAEVWLARPLLPPVNPIKPRKCITEAKKKRSSSSASTRPVTSNDTQHRASASIPICFFKISDRIRTGHRSAVFNGPDAPGPAVFVLAVIIRKTARTIVTATSA